MAQPPISRRRFLSSFASGAALATLGACGCGDSLFGRPRTGPQVVYRLSVRGQRASTASKRNAAYKRFLTPAGAEAGRAHPGDCSRVVPITVSLAQWQAWFGGGAVVVDVRRVA
jgi:hypothetical protein